MCDAVGGRAWVRDAPPGRTVEPGKGSSPGHSRSGIELLTHSFAVVRADEAVAVFVGVGLNDGFSGFVEEYGPATV